VTSETTHNLTLKERFKVLLSIPNTILPNKLDVEEFITQVNEWLSQFQNVETETDWEVDSVDFFTIFENLKTESQK
jgi:hypothetical protein